MTQEQVIDKFIKIHGNKYDYSKVVYEGHFKEVIITCPVHGDFYQKPKNHLRGYGCKRCGCIHLLEVRGNKPKTEQSKFIEMVRQVHEDKYDYSLVEYTGCKNLIKIICPKHGIFEQKPYLHLNGKGCYLCGLEKIGDLKRKTVEQFIEEARQIHGEKYDYSLVEYKNAHTKVKIICPKHGVFEMRPNNHTSQQQGCPKCANNNSKAEEEVYNFISSLYSGEIIRRSKSIINNFELDIYIPEKKLAIEYNGLYWHSENNGKDKRYHLNKLLECEKQKIKLIHIFEDEWENRKEIVSNIIKYNFGLIQNKVYARKCKIVEVIPEIARDFFNSNHLQGSAPSSIRVGLYYNNELIHCISFGKSRFNKHYTWEIIRDATKVGFQVIGGFSKCLNYFKNHHSGSIITFADRRYFTGDVYKKCGFTFLNFSEPNYFYFKDDNIRYSRVKFQKHKLKDILKKYNENLTEVENMYANDWNRIFDCGNYVYGINP
ncbi:MAG: DUF723 domain-containing protein [Elusimicrobiota bacterium]|jgi:hypothetical protein|nr:DUF723 domain-containing protein [Elusimicrobiota bacterium]